MNNIESSIWRRREVDLRCDLGVNMIESTTLSSRAILWHHLYHSVLIQIQAKQVASNIHRSVESIVE